MGFDAMAHDASVPSSNPKEIAKKKRVNRSAKLKQCKLDARREQWLSQVKNKGGCKVVVGITSSPPSHPPIPTPHSRHSRGSRHDDEKEGIRDQSDLDSSPSHSPSSSASFAASSHKDFSISNEGGGCSSFSSTYSTGSFSRCASDVEESGEDNGAVEDWEAVADALSADNDNVGNDQSGSLSAEPPNEVAAQEHVNKSPETVPLARPSPCAWRPDDAFRPQSLPNLSKQQSFPADIQRHRITVGAWAHRGILSAPTSCPICYEDLDSTDSSFLPCLCGFHLCLFCHKRILEDDGRCPGCRKQYVTANVPNAEIDVRGGVVLPLSVRLSRSCSIKY